MDNHQNSFIEFLPITSEKGLDGSVIYIHSIEQLLHWINGFDFIQEMDKSVAKEDLSLALNTVFTEHSMPYQLFVHGALVGEVSHNFLYDQYTNPILHFLQDMCLETETFHSSKNPPHLRQDNLNFVGMSLVNQAMQEKEFACFFIDNVRVSQHQWLDEIITADHYSLHERFLLRHQSFELQATAKMNQDEHVVLFKANRTVYANDPLTAALNILFREAAPYKRLYRWKQSNQAA